ncbi:MAG: hypothetical protein V8T31_02970 [Lachnospiraceae bacterium]
MPSLTQQKQPLLQLWLFLLYLTFLFIYVTVKQKLFLQEINHYEFFKRRRNRKNYVISFIPLTALPDLLTVFLTGSSTIPENLAMTPIAIVLATSYHPVPGKDRAQSAALSAHVDTLGLMVVPSPAKDI